MKNIKIVLVTLLVFLSINTFAQIEKPVRWSYLVTNKSNKEAVVLIRAVIEPNWHIYSQYIPDGGPVKTSFIFLPSKDYLPVGRTLEPKAISVYEPSFNMKVSYFENKVTFQQRVKLN